MSSDIPKILLGLTAIYVIFGDHIDYASVAVVLVIALLWAVIDR